MVGVLYIKILKAFSRLGVTNYVMLLVTVMKEYGGGIVKLLKPEITATFV